ncbi:MAG: tyrosine-protein phosphatase [Dehalococcoidia bacterium]|nr:tyrosine-protein phosphatase [Dehalococcoidia bacterium]
MPNWVVEGVIATSPRPGFAPGPELTVHDHVVDSWIEDARRFGIRSVMCLIGDDQLWLYRKAAPEGLLDRYRSSGFDVFHLPTVDQQTHPFTPEQYELAWEAFMRLPKPVLVHCSAGMDRTGRVVDFILARLDTAEAEGSAAG